MPSTIDQVQNFIEYTIVAPSGTGIGAGIDVTVVEDITNFPTASVSDPVTILAFDPNNEAATRELIEVTNKNNSLHTLRWATRGVDGSLPVDHLNNQKIRIVLNRRIIVQMKTAILALESAVAALQASSSPTVTVTAGEVFSATTTDPNGSGVGLPVTGPTLIYQAQATGKVLRSSTAAEESGGLETYGVAAGASAGDGSSIQMYKPGSIISGFTGLIPGKRYFPSSAVDGGWSITPGVHWRHVGHALTSTTMLAVEGKTSASLSAVGVTGTNPYNNGTSTRAARLDHEHMIVSLIPWQSTDPPTTGDKHVNVFQKWPFDVLITGFEFFTKTAGSTTTIGNVYWKTKTNFVNNTGSWVSIFNTPPQLASSVKSVSSSPTSFAGGNPTFTWSPDIVLKFELDAVGTGAGACGMQLNLKAKNTN